MRRCLVNASLSFPIPNDTRIDGDLFKSILKSCTGTPDDFRALNTLIQRWLQRGQFMYALTLVDEMKTSDAWSPSQELREACDRLYFSALAYIGDFRRHVVHRIIHQVGGRLLCHHLLLSTF